MQLHQRNERERGSCSCKPTCSCSCKPTKRSAAHVEIAEHNANQNRNPVSVMDRLSSGPSRMCWHGCACQSPRTVTSIACHWQPVMLQQAKVLVCFFANCFSPTCRISMAVCKLFHWLHLKTRSNKGYLLATHQYVQLQLHDELFCWQ